MHTPPDRRPFDLATICPSCDGSGCLAAFGRWYDCNDCGGAGYLVVRVTVAVDAVVDDADDRCRDEIGS